MPPRSFLRPRDPSRRRRSPVVLALVLLLLVAVAASSADSSGGADGDPVVVFFFEEGCPSCEVVEELLTGLAADLPPSAIRRYEISDPDAFDLLTRLAAAYEVEVDTVPVVFVGDEAIVGSGRSAEFGLRAAIGDCVVRGCPSPLDRVRPPEFPWSDLLRLVAFIGVVILLALLQPL
jgi:thiol-disulfide isomerase/thioredoxin